VNPDRDDRLPDWIMRLRAEDNWQNEPEILPHQRFPDDGPARHSPSNCLHGEDGCKDCWGEPRGSLSLERLAEPLTYDRGHYDGLR
jgi:hypothetical protein